VRRHTGDTGTKTTKPKAGSRARVGREKVPGKRRGKRGGRGMRARKLGPVNRWLNRATMWLERLVFRWFA